MYQENLRTIEMMERLVELARESAEEGGLRLALADTRPKFFVKGRKVTLRVKLLDHRNRLFPNAKKMHLEARLLHAEENVSDVLSYSPLSALQQGEGTLCHLKIH